MVEDRRGRGYQPSSRPHGKLSLKAQKDRSSSRLEGLPCRGRTTIPTLTSILTMVSDATARWHNVSPPPNPTRIDLCLNDLKPFGRTFRVIAQADARFREDPRDIAQLALGAPPGAPVPLGTILSIESRTGPSRVERYTLPCRCHRWGYRARLQFRQAPLPWRRSPIAFCPMDLASSGQPSPTSRSWLAIAVFISPSACCSSFLFLAALYESWSLPLSIILVVPMCVLAALAGVWLRGMDNNILTQIGFVVLVGLACKNAILIVEFAKQREEQGSDRFQAAVEASRLRLRPILMTSFAFIFGVLPLVLASGAGAEMRQSLGTAVFSGMLGVTFLGCF